MFEEIDYLNFCTVLHNPAEYFFVYRVKSNSTLDNELLEWCEKTFGDRFDVNPYDNISRQEYIQANPADLNKSVISHISCMYKHRWIKYGRTFSFSNKEDAILFKTRWI